MDEKKATMKHIKHKVDGFLCVVWLLLIKINSIQSSIDSHQLITISVKER